MNPKIQAILKSKGAKIAGKVASIAAIVLLVALSVLFIFRRNILQFVVKEVTTRVERKYPVDLVIGKADYVGVKTVIMRDIAVIPKGADTLFTTDSVDAEISLWTVFKGRVVFSELKIANAFVTARKTKTQNNYSFLLRKKPAEAPTQAKAEGRNYGEILNNLIERAFENVPEEVTFRNLLVTYESDNRNIRVNMPLLTVDEGNISSSLTVQTDSLVNKLHVDGSINPDDYQISANLYTTDTAGIRIPYIKEKYGAKLSFDSLKVSLTDKVYKQNRLTIKGEGRMNKLLVNHPKVADGDVEIDKGAINYVVTIGQDYYSLDTLTRVTLNKMVVYPQARLITKPSKRIALKVRSAQTEANDFFESLPKGMFETLEGIKAQGYLTYNMNFYVDLAQVDSLKFDSDLEGKYFNITNFGKTDLRLMNAPFEHTVYEYDKPVRTFLVGPQNPNFTPYNQISNYLKNSILTSEDYGFFKHKGFHEGAFRHSMITNIKEKNFTRGGSTISMQLVKNVFLTRKKTVARKVEEMLIVWLIENNRLTSKQRMYEVYLNIIEWGPNVYGVKEASRFFFEKYPSELNLAESLFLTSIIPRPKAYRYSFDAYGNLRNRPRYFFRLISGIMLRRGLISREEYDNLYPHVNLAGRARDLIVTATPPPDTTAVDSLQIDLVTPIDLLD
ncbi:biosynthetic peptidoglycan transglycosylase [Adhaeribacter pallidiroseus]|uniref:Monofunctional biosynthetic peptidoglycan transglycosylase n=1 Tax=Adhaeribacter pallidiroseus TaxID=2072847 RepID=A0A369QJI7_9BACT|nr:biosynthetic peptidoglycan transglycosylase [Adhaeribacter pallidiroseus]RDC63386.1 Monofunctional biosynthetic peptidoglycan transglycosylase [Adhaeribacter pallidiroseus]